MEQKIAVLIDGGHLRVHTPILLAELGRMEGIAVIQ